jgi:hypothetical protein
MKILAALLAVVPLAAFAQGAEPQPAPAAEYAPPPTYAPPPQYAPPAQPPPPAVYAPPQKQRDSWYIGFGLGGGSGSVKIAGESLDFDDMVYSDPTTLSFNIRAGATVSPKLLVGFDGGFVAASAEEQGYSSSIQLNYYDLGMMYFPAGRGFYLRGAAGLSSIVWDAEPYVDASARGFNVLGGVGYAFWLGRAFNLTLNVDAARHFFSEDDLEGGTAVGVWVGFDWY